MGKKLNATITIGGAVSGTLKGALNTTKSGLNDIGRAITDLKNRQRELNAVMREQERLGTAGSALKVDYANREAQQIGKQIGLLQRRLDIEKRIDALNEKRAGYAAGVGTGVALGAAIAGASAVAIKDAAEFRYQMVLLGNTANMTQGEVRALGDTIIQMSGRVGQSAGDMQKAMAFLVAAGMDVKVAGATLETVGRTATAAGADLEDVARAAFTLNDAFKIDPKNMQQALDILAQAGKEGNVELRDMAKQLPVLGSGFQALKMQGAEAAATMGAALEIARKGAADADEAANNMKNFIAKVMSPETLKKAKKTFNLDLYKIITDAQTKGKNPFEAAMVAIMKATQGDQKKIGELFGDMQAQNFIRPMIQNWEEYQRIKNKALSARGVTDADFANVMGTTKKELDNLSQSFDRFKIAIGDALDGPGAGFLRMLGGAVSRMADFAAAHPQVVAGVVGLGLAFAGATIAINATAWALTSVRIAALRAQGAWTTFRAVLAGVQASSLGTSLLSLAGTLTGVLAPAFTAVGAAIMATPIGWIAAGIAAVVAGGVLIYKYWEPLKAFFAGFGQGLVAGFAPIAQAISDAFAPVVAVVGPIVRPILQGISSAIGSIVGWFQQLLTPISAASETTKSWGEAGKAAGEAVAFAIKAVLFPMQTFIGLIQTAISKVGVLGEKWRAVKGWFGGGGGDGGKAPPKRAYGGPVRAGQSYVVGERRRELFVPNADGRILSSIPQARPASSPAQAMNDNRQYHFNITAAPGQDARAIADEVERRVRSSGRSAALYDHAQGY